VRSLGEKGKKVGMSSVLPTALRDLEFRGVIERTLEEGKLDTERYVWRTANPDGGWDVVHVPDDAVGRWAELARIFLGYAGPARVEDFAEWTGLPLRDARAGLEQARPARVAVEGFADEAFVLEEDAAALRRPAEPSRRVAMLSFEDNFLVAHGGPRWVVDPAHWATPIQVWGGTKGGTLGDARHVQTRTVTIGDELAGIWEMDPDAGKVLWAPFRAVAKEARAEVEKLAEETASFLKEEIGHARSFSLDTEESVRERAKEVVKMKKLPGTGTGARKSQTEKKKPEKKTEKKKVAPVKAKTKTKTKTKKK
jgi:hypothetical protein